MTNGMSIGNKEVTIGANEVLNLSTGRTGDRYL